MTSWHRGGIGSAGSVCLIKPLKDAMQLVKILSILMHEHFSSPMIARQPEPTALMDDASQVAAFHAQGEAALLPVYYFNALATSRRVPKNGTVVDLGSGSGQYLAFLAQCRPDIKIVGIELAPKMVETGRRLLAERACQDRVVLRVGDMTAFAATLEGPVDLVCSVFSLHHLPDIQHLSNCLSQIHLLRQRTGCGLWVFDHVRPKHPSTPSAFTQAFTPDAPPEFNRDSANSLIAAFSVEELDRELTTAQLTGFTHWQSRWMNLYQVIALDGTQTPQSRPELWCDPRLTGKAAKDWRGLRALFPSCPSKP